MDRRELEVNLVIENDVGSFLPALTSHPEVRALLDSGWMIDDDEYLGTPGHYRIFFVPKSS